jgi:hypothetical protein
MLVFMVLDLVSLVIAVSTLQRTRRDVQDTFGQLFLGKIEAKRRQGAGVLTFGSVRPIPGGRIFRLRDGAKAALHRRMILHWRWWHF